MLTQKLPPKYCFWSNFFFPIFSPQSLWYLLNVYMCEIQHFRGFWSCISNAIRAQYAIILVHGAGHVVSIMSANILVKKYFFPNFADTLKIIIFRDVQTSKCTVFQCQAPFNAVTWHQRAPRTTLKPAANVTKRVFESFAPSVVHRNIFLVAHSRLQVDAC